MKSILTKIAYPLIILIIAASCSSPRYASAQNDEYYDDNAYNNNNNNQGDNYNSNYDDAGNYEVEPSNVNITVFNDALSPYGTWMQYQGYGRVWRPNNHGFVPYSTGGHWVYSSYGWTWASDYNWGWAPFHYGRWAYDPFYGWMWVPGNEWGPAWVSWRSGGGYYGWTPLSPGMSIGVNIGVPYNRWVFAPCRYMGYHSINKYYVRPSRNVNVINNTTIINNTTVYNNRKFVAGPNRTDVERYTGKPVNRVRIENASKPGTTVVKNNNTVQMYRPGVTAKPKPNLPNTQGQDNVNHNNQNNIPAPDNRDRINDNRQQQQNNHQQQVQQNQQQRDQQQQQQRDLQQQQRDQQQEQQRQEQQQQRNQQQQQQRDQQQQERKQQQEQQRQQQQQQRQSERKEQMNNQPQKQQPPPPQRGVQSRHDGGNNHGKRN